MEQLWKYLFKEQQSRFFEDDAFTSPANELLEFEKKFPYKEKLKTDTQFE